MAPLKVALFVEGSAEEKLRDGASALERLWQDIAAAAGARAFSRIYGISKKHLLALDPENPQMSGQAEPLDELMERMRLRDGFEAAVVAWDLVPRWNANAEMCRRVEVLDFYRLLGNSRALPPEFASHASARHLAIVQREPSSPILEQGATIALCMVPDFEAIFADLEASVFGSTGLTRRPAGWPKFKKAQRYDEVLGACVAAIPKSSLPRHLPRRWESAKNTWGRYFLESCLSDSSARMRLLAAPSVARLGAILASIPL